MIQVTEFEGNWEVWTGSDPEPKEDGRLLAIAPTKFAAMHAALGELLTDAKTLTRLLAAEKRQPTGRQ